MVNLCYGTAINHYYWCFLCGNLLISSLIILEIASQRNRPILSTRDTTILGFATCTRCSYCDWQKNETLRSITTETLLDKIQWLLVSALNPGAAVKSKRWSSTNNRASLMYKFLRSVDDGWCLNNGIMAFSKCMAMFDHGSPVSFGFSHRFTPKKWSNRQMTRGTFRLKCRCCVLLSTCFSWRLQID